MDLVLIVVGSQTSPSTGEVGKREIIEEMSIKKKCYFGLLLNTQWFPDLSDMSVLMHSAKLVFVVTRSLVRVGNCYCVSFGNLRHYFFTFRNCCVNIWEVKEKAKDFRKKPENLK